MISTLLNPQQLTRLRSLYNLSKAIVNKSAKFRVKSKTSDPKKFGGTLSVGISEPSDKFEIMKLNPMAIGDNMITHKFLVLHPSLDFVCDDLAMFKGWLDV